MVQGILMTGFAVTTTAYETKVHESTAQTQQLDSNDSVYGDFQYTVSDGKVTVTKYTGSATAVSIPSKIEGKPVTSIGNMAFYGCRSLTSVTIPNNVINIGSSGFSFCDNLKNITIGNNVASIASNAFAYCHNLLNINVNTNNPYYRSISRTVFNKDKTTLICYPAGKSETVYTIPNNVITISDQAFAGNDYITNIVFPNSVKNIGAYTFEDCSKLTTVSLPNSITNMKNGVFYGCINLKNISLPNSITEIRSRTFDGCSSLENITIPNSVTIIGEMAFAGCENLRNIVIPNNVITIGFGAFSYCNSLKNVIIPQNVKDIGISAFEESANLLSIDVHKDNDYYSSTDGVLFNKKRTKIICYPEGKTNKNYTIPNTVTDICGIAFSHCSSLTNVEIPNSVTSIGSAAFKDCRSLTSVKIPNSVTSIDIFAFGYDNNYSPIDGFTIRGTKGSAAESYANENGFKFVDSSTIEVTGVSLNKTALTLEKGKQQTLTATVTPTNATDKTVTWKSSNTSVATISNGKVTAKSVGTATITAKTSNGKTAACKITVVEELTSISINKSSLIVGIGETFKFSCKTNTGTSAKVTYTSSKTSVVTVDSKGNMKAKSTGTAIITATTDNGKTAKCRVTVKNAPTSISINRKNSIMGLGETFYLEGSLANDEASRVMTFSSNKPEVATVTDGGIVTAKSIGTAIVSITTYNGKKATCRVTVRNAPTSLQFNKTSITLKQGETFYLESQFNTGEYARTVIYNSPDKSVATISGSGVIMAKNIGTVEITGKTYNGKTQTCTVTVK